MTLYHQIKQKMKHAMINGNKIELSIIRVLVGEIQTIQTRTGEDLTDEKVIRMIRKFKENNLETIVAAEGRKNLETVDILNKENEFLDAFLPQLWGEEKLAIFLADKKDLIAAAPNSGAAIGVVMKALKAIKAPVDGKLVASAVKAMKEQP